MADIRKQFGFDAEAADKGVKMPLGIDIDTEYILIRRHSNPEYIDLLTKTLQANDKIIQYTENTDPKAAQKLNVALMCEVLAKTIVVEVGPGVYDGKKKVSNTVEGRKQLLIDYPDLHTQCILFSKDNKNYPLKPDIEEIKKS